MVQAILPVAFARKLLQRREVCHRQLRGRSVHSPWDGPFAARGRRRSNQMTVAKYFESFADYRLMSAGVASQMQILPGILRAESNAVISIAWVAAAR